MKRQPAEFTNASEHDLDSESRLERKAHGGFPTAQLTATRSGNRAAKRPTFGADGDVTAAMMIAAIARPRNGESMHEEHP
jgi:hypothetical protein